MADTAFQTQYRQEFISAFEYGETLLRKTCITEANIKGNQAVFLVAGTGGAEAVTRGVNGRIPARPDDLTQLTCTLAEWHDKVERTDFNIMSSQGNGRRIMQQTTVKVLNRKIDADIIAELDTATLTAGAAAPASLSLISKAIGILGNNEVPVEDEDNIFVLGSPAMRHYLNQVPEFNSADYVEVKGLSGRVTRFRRWAGANFIFHPRLTGNGTSSEACFAYHRDSIGHAMHMAALDIAVGYNEEDAYSFARATGHMGSKKLQNTGIVKILHDGSAVGTGS